MRVVMTFIDDSPSAVTTGDPGEFILAGQAWPIQPRFQGKTTPIRNQKSEIRNQKLETRNHKPVITML